MRRTQNICVPGEVHLWRIDLDCTATSVTAFKATLSAEELERAARFRSRELCERWAVARGALRCILAMYLQSEPTSVVLRAGPYGKPALVWPAENISFNLSHTGDLMLLAITRNGRVGVDAEIVRTGIEEVDLSRRFFAPVEADEILRLPPEKRRAAFFACWTRKEAFLKALGAGLSMPLDRFRVTVGADQPAQLMSFDCGESRLWTLLDVGEPGIAATLAVEGLSPVLRRLEFTPPSS